MRRDEEGRLGGKGGTEDEVLVGVGLQVSHLSYFIILSAEFDRFVYRFACLSLACRLAPSPYCSSLTWKFN